MQEHETTNHMTLYTRYWILSAIVLTALLNSPQALPKGQHDLLLFLSGGPAYNEVSPESGPDGTEFVADADIVYSYTNGRFKILGEYLLSTDESELERLKLGWHEADTIGWIGRFHSPSRYWNSTYHHGQYMQTSISRPLIEQFEDDGGVLPTHITGLMVETMSSLRGSSGLQTTVSFGAGPSIGKDQLQPVDLLDPDSNHGAAADLRLGYLPDQLGDNQVGLIMVWNWPNWNVVGTVVYVNNQDKLQTRTLDDTFTSGYIQAQYSFHPDWILYGRLEESNDAEDSLYLTLFPNTIADRQVLGLRFDFTRNQALTLEVARVIEFAEADTQDRFGQAMLQWSTVLPWAW